MRLLTVGLMHNDAKGIDLLLEALPHLSREVHLDVIGDGPLRPAYERLARNVGVDDAVTFRGLLPKAEVAAAMRRADLFVLASRYENNPCVLLEAMASGLPVVATRVGGVPEIAHPPAALLATPNDVDSLVAKLREAIEHRDRFDREAIAREAIERYGRATVAGQLAEVYASVRGIAVEELQR